MVKLKLSDYITLSRLPLAVLLLLLTFEGKKIEAVIVLFAMGFSDWLDGFVAKTRKEANRFGSLLDKGVDYLIACILIPAMIYLRTSNLASLFMGLATLLLGIFYFRSMLQNKKIGGTQLGKPLLTLAVFTCYLTLILDFYWQYALAFTLCCWIVNIILFLKGKYRKE